MQTYNIGKEEKADFWETRVLGIDGMTCDHCARSLTRALKEISGVKDARVDRAEARAEVTFDRKKTDLPAIHDTILRSGFKPAREVPA